jgi:hypothetical protein
VPGFNLHQTDAVEWLRTLGNESVDLVVTDPDNAYPGSFSLKVERGANYKRQGNTITPDEEFAGELSVPVTVDDGSGADNSESDTFVLTLPQLVGFKYAVIATEQRTLVARVESLPGPVRLSGAVAKTLGLSRDEWAEVQIVALRELDRVVSVGQVFSSARIALPQD